MRTTISKLRQDVPDQKPSNLARLKKRTCIVGNHDSIIHMDWLKEWSELKGSTSTHTVAMRCDAQVL
jgi:hypothetical protein